jgi:hypothetical protein
MQAKIVIQQKLRRMSNGLFKEFLERCAEPDTYHYELGPQCDTENLQQFNDVTRLHRPEPPIRNLYHYA